jgi:predicted AlkP superfamily phosphohydrolase/phosphomutase
MELRTMNKRGDRSRVLVLGLDGATYDLLRPWFEQGELPNLRHLVERGATGELTTVIPPYTPVAWPSIMSGKNPGKHGVFDFMYRDRDQAGFEISFYNRSHVDAKFIWQIVGDQGRKVGVINIPMTYPPEPVNGFMITGLMTPPDAAFTYPLDLANELEREVGGYLITERNLYTSDLDALLAELLHVVERRAATVDYLLRAKDWDLCIVVFTSTDVAQHQFWKFIDPTHPDYTPKGAERYGDAILRVFRQIDGQLPRLLAHLNDDDYIVLMSDHGFGTLHNFIYANSILAELGLLCFKHTPWTLLLTWLFKMGLTPLNVYRIMHRLNLGSANDRRQRQKVRNLMKLAFLSFDDVDWSRTKAYALGNFGQLYLNLKGREPEGIIEPGAEYKRVREEIKQQLADFRDPRSGKQVLGRILTKDEVYAGEHFEEAPDLLYFPADEQDMVFGKYEFGSRTVVEPAFATSGQHKLNSIFAAIGPRIRPGSTVNHGQVLDLAPTLLYMLGLPIPRDMDGRVLTEVFEKPFVDQYPATYSEPTDEHPTCEENFSAEEEELIRERLQDLGYLA